MPLVSQGSAETQLSRGVVVNDLHSGLNATAVKRVLQPASLIQLSESVKAAARLGVKLSIAGGRHAMGGQQFQQNGWLIDMTALDRVLDFNATAGTVRCEAGATWPKLIAQLERLQSGSPTFWTFAQKQTGADHLTLGGAVAANIHGRGLRFRPLVQQVLALDIVTQEGRLIRCSREENAELFRLVIGGYGLFGVVYAVTLQLVQRIAVRRSVDIVTADGLIERFDAAVLRGALYGDFQFSIDPNSRDFLYRGVFSVYEPAPGKMPGSDQKALRPADWERLLLLAHTDKSAGFREYSDYYRSTDGQVYWSDLHQWSYYPEGYHQKIDQCIGGNCPGSEMITELYVPRHALSAFLQKVRISARRHAWNIIYGTIRLIERDDESFLSWAREPWACVIFNVCVKHSASGIEQAKSAFRHRIQIAMDFGGTYYLTYHKWATRDQLLACYPQIPEFLSQKRRFDPQELFVSNWYESIKRTVAARS